MALAQLYSRSLLAKSQQRFIEKSHQLKFSHFVLSCERGAHCSSRCERTANLAGSRAPNRTEHFKGILLFSWFINVYKFD